MEDPGLDWEGLVSDIESLSQAGCYEKVNRITSLFQVDKLRREAASLVSGGTGVYADLGAGPGTSARVVRGLLGASTLILVDPSARMLALSLEEAGDPRVLRVGGRFERLPFRDDSLDGVTAMFSYRDAVDYREALDEIARVLKPRGRLAILDLYRHPSLLLHGLVKLYFKIMVPVALFASRCPARLTTYKSLLASIDRMLTDRELMGELEERFKVARVMVKAPGLAIFYAAHPRGKG